MKRIKVDQHGQSTPHFFQLEGASQTTTNFMTNSKQKGGYDLKRKQNKHFKNLPPSPSNYVVLLMQPQWAPVNQ